MNNRQQCVLWHSNPARHLAETTGLPTVLATNLVEATSYTGAYVLLSGMLKPTAATVSRICNDLRLLSSGPRGWLNEINQPQLQPGSSIMPGKVNPVIPEVVNPTAYCVIGTRCWAMKPVQPLPGKHWRPAKPFIRL